MSGELIRQKGEIIRWEGEVIRLEGELIRLEGELIWQEGELIRQEWEFIRLNENCLGDQAAIFKNTALLNDCKPTEEFLNMEQRKGGYDNLTKLRVQRTDAIAKTKVEEEIIDPSKIRDGMKTLYQNIFNRQNVKEGTEAIDELSNLANDDNPYLKNY